MQLTWPCFQYNKRVQHEMDQHRHHTRTLGGWLLQGIDIFNLYSAHKNELVLSGRVSRVFQESCFVFLGIDDVMISLAANEWLNVAEDR